MRRRLHGLRQSRARAPGDRLPRARSTAQRPGRVRQPLRFRILGVAQDPPAARLHARGFLGPGARHAGRLVYRLHARPPRHWHRGAAPRGSAGARGVAVGARPRGRGRYPGRGAHGRRFADRPRHGGCPLGRPRRGRRGLGGPVRRLRGHQGEGSRRDDRHARALRRRQAGLDHIGRDRDRDGARFGSRARARRRRRRRARRPVRTDLRDHLSPPCRHHRPRPRARQSSRRVGHRSRLPAGAHVVARRSGGGRCRRRGRRLPRPRAGARRRHRQRASRDRRLQLDDQARGSAGQSAQCDQPRGGGAAAGGRRPGARGHPDGPARHEASARVARPARPARAARPGRPARRRRAGPGPPERARRRPPGPLARKAGVGTDSGRRCVRLAGRVRDRSHARRGRVRPGCRGRGGEPPRLPRGAEDRRTRGSRTSPTSGASC